MAIHSPLGGSNERNRLAAKLAERRRHSISCDMDEDCTCWSPEEIAEMEAGDAEFNDWEGDLERLKALVGP